MSSTHTLCRSINLIVERTCARVSQYWLECAPNPDARAQVDELSRVAAKYSGTLEENRRLYNEVQDLKGNIRVFCRVRPPGATGDPTPSAPRPPHPARPGPGPVGQSLRVLLHAPAQQQCLYYPVTPSDYTTHPRVGIHAAHGRARRACWQCGALPTSTHPKALGRSAGCAEVGVEGELAVYNPRGGGRKQFKFDRVFGPAATQAEVYEDTKFLIRSVLDGAQQRNLHCKSTHSLGLTPIF